MATDDVFPAQTLILSATESTQQQEEDGDPAQSYRPPQLLVIGKAIDLVQSGSGKHVDDYSGWYWSGEG
jgi:hypothetical protein